MKARRFTEEQIIGVLREAEAGAKTKELCRQHGISADATIGTGTNEDLHDSRSVPWSLQVLHEHDVRGLCVQGTRPQDIC